MQERINFAAANPARAWINFAENVPERSSPSELLAGGWDAALRYEDSTGNMSLREALVARLDRDGISGTPDNVVVTSGGMGALNLIARELRQRGTQTVYCQTPLFHSVGDCMIAAGLQVKPLNLDECPSDLRLGDSIYVNSPHNPSGRVLRTFEYSRLLAWVKNVGGTLIVDSVYDDHDVYGEGSIAREVASLAVQDPSVLKVGSMSKNYGLPGLRVGWVIGHTSWAPTLAARLEWEMVSVPGPNQLLAAALVPAPDSVLQATVHRGRDFVIEWVDRNQKTAGVKIDGPPSGGTQLWVETDLTDTEEFADYAFRHHNLLLTTYANYWWASPKFLRLPVGHSLETLNQGLDVLAVALTKFRQKDSAAVSEGEVKWDAS